MTKTDIILKEQVKKLLVDTTGGCDVQHDGWPCGTCFLGIDNKLTNQDWQAILLYRGDYERKQLTNLPKNPAKAINKIIKLILDKDK